MKKMMLSLALVIGLGTTQINAQEVREGSKAEADTLTFILIRTNARGAYGGIKVEANTSNFILNDMDGMKSNLGFGVTVGGYTKVGFGEHFALQPEVLLHYKNSVMEDEATGTETDFQYFGVEIPLYAVGQVNLGKGKGFLGIGPYLEFGIDARYKADGTDDLNLYKEYNGSKSAMQRWDFGAGAMLGYEFSCRLQILATYKIGFIDALNAGKDNATLLPQAVSLGLGYRF